MSATTANDDHADEISRLLSVATQALYQARQALDEAARLSAADLAAEGPSSNSSIELGADIARALSRSVARDSKEWDGFARARAMSRR
jgi:hypothetical protein